jgi:molecular chaperone GrpE
MVERQVLWERFCDFLETYPDVPETGATDPGTDGSFDLKAMVAGWIALRGEVKQQNKLFLTASDRFEQALAEIQGERTRRSAQSLAEQKAFFRELLGVMDALDRAVEGLREATGEPGPSPDGGGSRSFLQRLWNPGRVRSESESWRESLASHRQGVVLIRETLLDLLRQHQVIPVPAAGQSFDPRTMYAVGRERSDLPENTVSQEIVRGYLWGDNVLREARVMVSAKDL